MNDSIWNGEIGATYDVLDDLPDEVRDRIEYDMLVYGQAAVVTEVDPKTGTITVRNESLFEGLE
jgi:hypothetical protein